MNVAAKKKDNPFHVFLLFNKIKDNFVNQEFHFFNVKTLEILNPKWMSPFPQLPVVSPINPFSIIASELVNIS